MGGKFKFQVQGSDLEYLFWQCGKHIALSEKKTPLAIFLDLAMVMGPKSKTF